MAHKKQTTDHTNPVKGTSFAGNPVNYLPAAKLQDNSGTSMKGSNVPPMKQPKNLG